MSRHDGRACLAVRTVVDEFAPSTSQRRILRANTDLAAAVKAPRATAEQYELFATYQRSRHFDGDMASMDFYDYQALVEETPVESSVVELRDRGGRLISACLVDHMSDGLSAVYSFFDPAESRRSPGTHLVLWLIEQAQSKGLPYVYLGYWVPGSRKMDYKGRFLPQERLMASGWTRVEK